MSCISYLEEQLAHDIRKAATRVSNSDMEDEDRDNAWLENADNDEDDDGDSDYIAPDWETVSISFFRNIFFLRINFAYFCFVSVRCLSFRAPKPCPDRITRLVSNL